MERGYILTEEDRIRGRLIERLMTRLEVTAADLSPWPKSDWATLLDPHRGEIEAMQRDGLVESGADRLAVTRLGRFFLRSIARCLDAAPLPVETATPQHSQAV